MWSCPRCGGRNDRAVTHCGKCGMPNPFGDGGSTRNIDIPPVEPDRPSRARATLPWAAIAVAAVALLTILVLAVVMLTA
ncbi:hypothetical protein BH23ACT10_BH23ACT10_35400 [soil metagenome]